LLEKFVNKGGFPVVNVGDDGDITKRHVGPVRALMAQKKQPAGLREAYGLSITFAALYAAVRLTSRERRRAQAKAAG